MKTSFLLFIATALLVSSLPTKVQASLDYEELTYDDLVTQLSEKKDQITQKKNQQQQGLVHTHLSLGVLNTWNEISSQGHTFRPNMNGFEVASGMDLNSEVVRGEVSFRNFFEHDTGSQKSSLHELGADIQFRNEVNRTWQSKFMGGFAVRILRFKDRGAGVDVDDTSSMLMAGAGLEARLSPSVSFGGDLSTRLPFGTTTADRNSIDMGLKLDTTF